MQVSDLSSRERITSASESLVAICFSENNTELVRETALQLREIVATEITLHNPNARCHTRAITWDFPHKSGAVDHWKRIPIPHAEHTRDIAGKKIAISEGHDLPS